MKRLHASPLGEFHLNSRFFFFFFFRLRESLGEIHHHHGRLLASSFYSFASPGFVAKRIESIRSRSLVKFSL